MLDSTVITDQQQDSRRLVCHCFNITEAELIESIGRLRLNSIQELCQRTGAGNGCMCCRKLLARYLTSATVD